jgi:hypothetical protein
MGRVTPAGAASETATPVVQIIRRIVVVQDQPAPEPYISLEAAPAGQTVTVVTTPARVIHVAPAAPAPAVVVAAPVTTSSGS